MSAECKEQFKDQILAVVFRSGKESYLTMREMVEALHETVEHLVFLEVNHEEAL